LDWMNLTESTKFTQFIYTPNLNWSSRQFCGPSLLNDFADFNYWRESPSKQDSKYFENKKKQIMRKQRKDWKSKAIYWIIYGYTMQILIKSITKNKRPIPSRRAVI
jgi:hypothetical protein